MAGLYHNDASMPDISPGCKLQHIYYIKRMFYYPIMKHIVAYSPTDDQRLLHACKPECKPANDE